MESPESICHCGQRWPLSLGGSSTPKPSSPALPHSPERKASRSTACARQASTCTSSHCSKRFRGPTEETCRSDANPGGYPPLSCTRGDICHTLPWISANLDVIVESGVSAWILRSCKPQRAVLRSLRSNPISNAVPRFHNLAPNTQHDMKPWNVLFMANIKLRNYAYGRECSRLHTYGHLTAPSTGWLQE